MKKTAIIAAVVLLCISFAAAGWGAGATYNGYPVVNVMVNGTPVTSDVPAIVMDGKTLVPISVIAKYLGLNSTYDQSKNLVTIGKSEEKRFVLPEYQGSSLANPKTVKVDGETIGYYYEINSHKVVDYDIVKLAAEKLGINVKEETNALNFYLGNKQHRIFYDCYVDDKPHCDVFSIDLLETVFYGHDSGRVQIEKWY